MEEKKLIFTAYQDKDKNIRLGISPDLNSFTNGTEYFIDLGNNLLSLNIKNIPKLEPKEKKENNDE